MIKTRKYKKFNKFNKVNKYNIKSKKFNKNKKQKLRGGVLQEKICGLDRAFIERLFIPNISPLEALGLNMEATTSEIKKQYHMLSLKIHPDKCDDFKATEIFEKIKYFYDILISDADKSPLYPPLSPTPRSSPQPTTSKKTKNTTYEEKYISLNGVIERTVEDIKDIRFNNLEPIYSPYSPNSILLKLLKKSTNHKLSIENIDEEYNNLTLIRTNLDTLETRLSELSLVLNSREMMDYEKYLKHMGLYDGSSRETRFAYKMAEMYRLLIWGRHHIKSLSEQIGRAFETIDKIEDNLSKTKQRILNKSKGTNQSRLRKLSSTLTGTRKRTSKIMSDKFSTLRTSRLFSPRSSRPV